MILRAGELEVYGHTSPASTNLVGFISKSNSIIFAIHQPLFPSMSGYTRMSFTEAEGTYVVTFECKT
jgi:hypothetical protein